MAQCPVKAYLLPPRHQARRSPMPEPGPGGPAQDRSALTCGTIASLPQAIICSHAPSAFATSSRAWSRPSAPRDDSGRRPRRRELRAFTAVLLREGQNPLWTTQAPQRRLRRVQPQCRGRSSATPLQAADSLGSQAAPVDPLAAIHASTSCGCFGRDAAIIARAMSLLLLQALRAKAPRAGGRRSPGTSRCVEAAPRRDQHERGPRRRGRLTEGRRRLRVRGRRHAQDLQMAVELTRKGGRVCCRRLRSGTAVPMTPRLHYSQIACTGFPHAKYFKAGRPALLGRAHRPAHRRPHPAATCRPFHERHAQSTQSRVIP